MDGTSQLLISFYGDDFTGSTASLESLARAGVRTRLFIEPPTPQQLARCPGLQAIGVAGLTRSMTPEAIEAELRPAFAALKALGAPHLHYKVCSTFDSSPTIGSIGKAIDVGSEIFPGRFVPLLVGMPSLGRYCVFGNLFARSGHSAEVFRLDRHPSMSRHPSTPADESDLRLHVSRQTKKRIALFDVLKVALPPAQARDALENLLTDGSDIVLFDILDEQHLRNIGRLIDEQASPEHPLFSVGSSDVEAALTAHWAGEGRLLPVEHWPAPATQGPILVLSGSCSPVTKNQIAWALAHGFAEVPLDTAGITEQESVHSTVSKASSATAAHLKNGRSVVVHISEGPIQTALQRGMNEVALKPDSARLFGTALGQVARATLEKTPLRRLVVAGGDTSGFVARTLGIESLEMIAPLEIGAPLCHAHAPATPADGLEVNFKGGQVGAEDYFGLMAGKPNAKKIA
jgi:uncharacterized protein YgbK (DUF1537 family)